METGESLQPGEVNVSDFSLYKDLRLLLGGSILIYGIADLRELARKGDVFEESTANEILTIGSESKHDQFYFDVFEQHKDKVLKHIGSRGTELYLGSIDDVREEAEAARAAAATLEVFEDENNTSECVYAIVMDRFSKRIVVYFRGSATPHDWMIDATMTLKTIPNPVPSIEKEELKIHGGFHQYLYGTTSDRKMSKFDKIMGEVVELLQENPGYRLVSAGHSLGGALSILFAFSAAASSNPLISEPVLSVSFGSPRVGNDKFRDAVEVLEKQHKLVVLRVANQGDPITKMPNATTLMFGYRVIPSLNFRHVGLELKLRKGSPPSFIHSTSAGSSGMKRTMKDMYHDFRDTIRFFICPCCGRGSPTCHLCGEYVKRLNGEAKKDLKTMSLNTLRSKILKKEIDYRESICR